MRILIWAESMMAVMVMSHLCIKTVWRRRLTGRDTVHLSNTQPTRVKVGHDVQMQGL